MSLDLYDVFMKSQSTLPGEGRNGDSSNFGGKVKQKSRKTKFPRTRWLNFRIQPRICPLLRHI